MKKTSLYQHHITLGAKMIEYAGFDMPISYTDISKEHHAVREQMGIFDVSHMGEFLVEGPDAVDFVNRLVTNQVTPDTTKVTYALLCDKDGFVIDDLLVYVLKENQILLVVNAGNIDKDFAWIQEQVSSYNVTLRNISDAYSQVALQGPLVKSHINDILGSHLTDLKFMTYQVVPYQDGFLIASRTGYTGEDGFEIYGSHDLIIDVWQQALEQGAVPCGLGARDTLRFEANLPLYGHELSDTITPLEAGLGFAVKFDKAFIGKDALIKQVDHLERKIVGLELLEKGIPRQGYEIFNEADEKIGFITTGYLSPSLNKPIALAMISVPNHKLGTTVYVFIRNQKIRAKIISRKFLTKQYIK